MIPSIEFAGKTFTPYYVMSLIGITVCVILAFKDFKKTKLDDNNLIIMLFISAVGLLLGGHILYGITQIPFIIHLIENPDLITNFSDFISYFSQIFGGSVFYGGLFGALLSANICLNIMKEDKKIYARTLVPYIPLFHFFGRIGCFLGGCCHGLESKFGFVYRYSLNENINGHCLFPIQLVEATCNLILFFVLKKLAKDKNIGVNILPIYLFSYSIVRFVDEFFRGDEIRGVYFGLSTSQIISLIIFISMSIYFFKYFHKKIKL